MTHPVITTFTWLKNLINPIDHNNRTGGNAKTLTHWGRVTHICVGNLTIIGSDNGLSPGRRQAIIWTNAGILLIGPLGTNFDEIVIGIQTFSLKKIYLKMSSGKWRPLTFGLIVLKDRFCWRTIRIWIIFVKFFMNLPWYVRMATICYSWSGCP